MTYRLSLNEWLDFFGFSASPFSRWEAAEEARLHPERLSALWVKPACFDRLFGQASEPRTVVTFAPRGSGKTACRILVHYYCRAGMGRGDRAGMGGWVLPILHTRFDEAVRQSKESQLTIDEYWHTRQILRQSIKALIDTSRAQPRVLQRIASLAPARRVDLEWFFSAYAPQSTDDLSFVRHRLNLRPFPSDRNLQVGFRATDGTCSDPSETSLPVNRNRQKASPIDQLHLLMDLICDADRARGLGFEAAYVLVDGLDEFLFSADLTTDHGARLIIPLLTNLRLMNGIPGLAFKFFLPAEMMPSIKQHAAVRHDRIGYETIAWTESDMQEILRRRLDTYGAVQQMDMLCAPELRGLEGSLIRAAKGNPRRMLRLCSHLLNVHLDRPLEAPPEELGESAYLFTPADWDEAQARLCEESTQVGPDKRGAEVPAPKAPVDQEIESSSESQGMPKHLDDYPAPIALLHLDYRHRQEPFERLGRLLDLFEVSSAFVSIVLVAQLAALTEEAPVKIRAANLRLKRMSLGGWLAVWERVPGICNTIEPTFYARRLQSIYSKERERLDRLRILRNQTLGHGATGSEEDTSVLVSRYAPEVEEVITSLHFLTTARLIQVKDMRMAGGLFHHRARVYVGDNPNFPWQTVSLTNPLECDTMLLIDKNHALQLYPLLLAERCPECGQTEIFVYQQVRNAEAEYLSYSSGHRLTTPRSREDIRTVIGA